MVVWMKACPRCKTGDLHLKADMYGKYIECVQCGFSKDMKVDKGVEKAAVEKTKAKAAAGAGK